jgi:biotin carboxylase
MNILIIEPIGSGAILVDTAVEMGWNCFLLSYNKSDRILPNNPTWQMCSIIEADTNNKTEVIDTLNKRDYKFDIIVSGNEYYVPLSIELSIQYGLRTLPKNLIHISHDKSLMRAYLKELKLDNIWFDSISGNDDIHTKSIEYPCIIKPKNAAGSFHVNKANNIQELEFYYNLAQQEQHKELDNNIGKEMLIEEYLHGPEYSVEGYFTEEQFYLASITKKFLSEEPYFVEIGHLTPSYDLSQKQQETIENYINLILSALKVKIGVIHAEIRFNKNNQPSLVEIAFRLPGDKIVDLIKLSRNIDLAKAMLCSYANIPYKPKVNKDNTYSCIAFFYNRKSEKEILEIKNKKEFISNHINKNIQRKSLTDYRDRNGYFIFTSQDYSMLLNNMKQVWGS